MITTAVVPRAEGGELAAYAEYVAGLTIGEGSRYARRHSARRFLAHHPDLDVWMARPTQARVTDLHRDKAWPFVMWTAVSGRLRVDVELLLAKPGGVDLSLVWDRLHPGDIDRAETVGRELGWSADWIRQVARHSLPVVCTWADKGLDGLGDEDLGTFPRCDGARRTAPPGNSAGGSARTSRGSRRPCVMASPTPSSSPRTRSCGSCTGWPSASRSPSISSPSRCSIGAVTARRYPDAGWPDGPTDASGEPEMSSNARSRLTCRCPSTAPRCPNGVGSPGRGGVGLSMAERKAVTKQMATRYERASKADKGAMLDELCALTRISPHHGGLGRG